MRSITKQQRHRAVSAVAMFTASVNLGAIGLKRAGGLEQGCLWTVVVLAANAALIVAGRVLRPEFPKRKWGPFCAFMAGGLAHASITTKITGKYEPDALWAVLLLSVVRAVIARQAFFQNPNSSNS